MLFSTQYDLLFFRLSRAVAVKEDLIEQLDMAENSKLTAEQRAEQLEMALKREEQRIIEVERELAKLREVQVCF